MASSFCEKMTSESKVKTSWEHNGKKIEREYRITYLDDSEERAEAVRFFGRALFPALTIPKVTYSMSERDAQAYFDEHPMQRQWSMLTLHSETGVSFEDDDLYRLEFFPELERLHSHADHLSDRGVSYFPRIPRLRHLLIYSPLVTDACLDAIAALRDLQTIDLQGSHRVTRGAFDRLVRKLPKLVDIYPPFDRPISEVYREAETKTQNKPW
jgi:hypothetical protein